MNLEDVIDPKYGPVNSVHSLQQDEWSLSKPRFGDEGQLEVVGWSGRNGHGKKAYILKCNVCSQDEELFGGGYFTARKDHLISAAALPCGCSKTPKWSKEQFTLRCSRMAKLMGYKFLGFDGDWLGARTRTKIMCEKHGEWSNSIHNLVNGRQGCMGCSVDSAKVVNLKSDKDMIQSFLASGAFHPDTKFWRSENLNSAGKATNWYVYCPFCEKTSESFRGGLQKGQRSCACSPHRQQECYINWVVDDRENAVAIKFGIANDSKQRVKKQNRLSAYEVRQYQIYSFPSVASCKKAERECKKELETGVVLKRDMPDGWTETTWSYNIGKVVDIYKRNGGVLV